MPKDSYLTWDVLPDEDAVSARAVEIIRATLCENPRALLCLPTGASPTKTYARLAATTEPALYEKARFLQLDEWGGLPDGDPATCFQYLKRHVVDPLRLDAAQLVRFHSTPADPESECARIRAYLDEQGPIDLCLLGLGKNGHIGLNEPAHDLAPRVHQTELTTSTRQHQMLRSHDQKRVYGMTLGIADILHSRRILLLVTGSEKRLPLQNLRIPKVRTSFPASLLHLHQNTTVLCDVRASEPAPG